MIGEPAVIKRTNEITSEQMLSLAKRGRLRSSGSHIRHNYEKKRIHCGKESR